MGDEATQFILGLSAERVKNYSEAVKCYRKSAEQGYAMAQNNLGEMYYYGRGVERNYYEAIKWIKRAAEQGDARARHNISVMYDKDKVTYQNKQDMGRQDVTEWHESLIGKICIVVFIIGILALCVWLLSDYSGRIRFRFPLILFVIIPVAILFAILFCVGFVINKISPQMGNQLLLIMKNIIDGALRYGNVIILFILLTIAMVILVNS